MSDGWLVASVSRCARSVSGLCDLRGPYQVLGLEAIEELSGVAGKSGSGTRKLSAAARARIASGPAGEMSEVQGEEVRKLVCQL
jgi:hypothetical protein